MKTINELRKACRENGIEMTKKTLSWGPHVTFRVDGLSSGSVMAKGDYEARKAKFEALKAIKARFEGLEINGERVRGLK